jgi:hypothetical protein
MNFLVRPTTLSIDEVPSICHVTTKLPGLIEWEWLPIRPGG